MVRDIGASGRPTISLQRRRAIVALTSLLNGRRIEIRLSSHSDDAEVLGCVVRVLEHPGYDGVDRALFDVSELASYEVQQRPRSELTGHLAGLFVTRPGLRIGIVYRELSVGELGGFVDEFCATTGFALAAFAGRQDAEAWLSQE
jgi:hypothetical protein